MSSSERPLKGASGSEIMDASHAHEIYKKVLGEIHRSSPTLEEYCEATGLDYESECQKMLGSPTFRGDHD